MTHPLVPLPMPAHKTLAEWATAQLRDLIVSGRLVPGARVYEHDLARRMSISRTPVREALRQLEREGLVSLSPNRETVVTDFSGTDVREIAQVRAALEGMAACLAAERRDEPTVARLFDLYDQMKEVVDGGGPGDAYTEIDMRFHDTILRASGNARLTEAVHRLRSQTLRYLLFNLRTWNQQGMEANVGEHRAVAEAIRDGDPNRAEDCMRAHINVSGGLVARALDRREERASSTGTT